MCLISTFPATFPSEPSCWLGELKRREVNVLRSATGSFVQASSYAFAGSGKAVLKLSVLII